jgi:hypothetical protein
MASELHGGCVQHFFSFIEPQALTGLSLRLIEDPTPDLCSPTPLVPSAVARRSPILHPYLLLPGP